MRLTLRARRPVEGGCGYDGVGGDGWRVWCGGVGGGLADEVGEVVTSVDEAGLGGGQVRSSHSPRSCVKPASLPWQACRDAIMIPSKQS